MSTCHASHGIFEPWWKHHDLSRVDCPRTRSGNRFAVRLLAPREEPMLARVGRFSFRHRRLVVIVWVGALALAAVGGSAVAGETATSGRLPNTDSQRAYDTPAREFPQRHGDEARIVFADIRRDRTAADAFLAQVAHAPGVIEVEPLLVSGAGTVAVAPITTAN